MAERAPERGRMFPPPGCGQDSAPSPPLRPSEETGPGRKLPLSVFPERPCLIPRSPPPSPRAPRSLRVGLAFPPPSLWRAPDLTRLEAEPRRSVDLGPAVIAAAKP